MRKTHAHTHHMVIYSYTFIWYYQTDGGDDENVFSCGFAAPPKRLNMSLMMVCKPHPMISKVHATRVLNTASECLRVVVLFPFIFFCCSDINS